MNFPGHFFFIIRQLFVQRIAIILFVKSKMCISFWNFLKRAFEFLNVNVVFGISRSRNFHEFDQSHFKILLRPFCLTLKAALLNSINEKWFGFTSPAFSIYKCKVCFIKSHRPKEDSSQDQQCQPKQAQRDRTSFLKRNDQQNLRHPNKIKNRHQS